MIKQLFVIYRSLIWVSNCNTSGPANHIYIYIYIIKICMYLKRKPACTLSAPDAIALICKFVHPYS